MIDSYLRTPYQRILVEPIANRLAQTSRLPADMVTVVGCLVGLLVWPLLGLSHHFLALGALLVSGYLDTLDASLSRLGKRTFPKGAAMDICCDRLVEIAVIVGLFVVRPESRAFPCIMMLASLLLSTTTFLTIRALTTSEAKPRSPTRLSLIESAETLLFFSAMILFPRLFSPLAITFALLVGLTAWLRLFEFMRTADR